MRKVILALFLSSSCFAGGFNNLQANIKPNGVTFGSASNTVTQDTATFVYDDRAGVYQLHIGSNPLNGGWVSAGYGPGSFVGWGNSGSGFEYPFVAIETSNSTFFPFISFMGDPGSASTQRFQWQQNNNNSTQFGQGTGTGSGGTIYFDSPLNTHIANIGPAGLIMNNGGINSSSITVNTLSVGIGGSSGKTVCWKTSSTFGFCSSSTTASGGCTCN